jgi:polyhydroxybutyrate depolymerase
VPLVLDFHGFTSDSFQQRLISGFLSQSDTSGFVVAHPNGYGVQRSWNAGPFCCGQAVAEKLDDVGLAKAIVKEISARVCIDPKRVYATGISNGGMLSHRLACEASSVFAAIAPVAGRIDLLPITSCQPGRPVPVIAFHGFTDELVPYQEAKNAIAHWVKVNGCTDPGSVTYTKGKASCTSYSTCSAGTKVSFCTLTAGHITYWNADSVSIAAVGWDFLSKFTMP